MYLSIFLNKEVVELVNEFVALHKLHESLLDLLLVVELPGDHRLRLLCHGRCAGRQTAPYGLRHDLLRKVDELFGLNLIREEDDPLLMGTQQVLPRGFLVVHVLLNPLELHVCRGVNVLDAVVAALPVKKDHTVPNRGGAGPSGMRWQRVSSLHQVQTPLIVEGQPSRGGLVVLEDRAEG